MAICSSILAWEIPWTEEPGKLQTMGQQRVECDRMMSMTLKLYTKEKNLKEGNYPGG